MSRQSSCYSTVSFSSNLEAKKKFDNQMFVEVLNHHVALVGTKYDFEILIYGVALMRRLKSHYDHRTFLLALFLSDKMLNDNYHTKHFWEDLFRVRISNHMEFEFMRKLKFSLIVEWDEFFQALDFVTTSTRISFVRLIGAVQKKCIG